MPHSSSVVSEAGRARAVTTEQRVALIGHREFILYFAVWEAFCEPLLPGHATARHATPRHPTPRRGVPLRSYCV